jgi:hypothetical protein
MMNAGFERWILESHRPATPMTLLVGSLAGGAICGAIGCAMFTPSSALPGLVFGVSVGFVVSPVLIVALRGKPLVPAMVIVTAPAALVACVGGLSWNPLVTQLSVVVFCAMAVVGSMILPDLPGDVEPGTCGRCGYDMTGLVRCPECGWVEADALHLVGPSRRAWVLAALVVLVGFVGPLVLAGRAAVERHRPRSTQELIEQLGANDIELQGEAMQALQLQGSAPLIIALSHSRPAVRENAARALGIMRAVSATNALTSALRDPDPRVREEAKRALDAIAQRK